MVESKILKALKNDDRSVLKSIYVEHKSAFISFAKKFPVSEEDIVDIYQDAIIALRENALKGHMDNLKSELKTYLFSIGKYMIYNRLKEKKKLHLIETIEEPDDFDLLQITQINYDVSERERQLQYAFNQLGEKCQKVIHLFYFRGFTLDDIVKELNYNNKDVVKSQKSRCIKHLKAIITNT